MTAPLTASDRALLTEHVGKLRDLAQTHQQFASARSDRSDCAQSKSDALAAAKRVERLAALIGRLLKEPGNG